MSTSSKPGQSPPGISPLWLVPLTLITASVTGGVLGRGSFFLVLAGGALLGAIVVLWQSLQSLTGDAALTLDEAIGMGAPSAEEERKAAVLRALKDLDYERQVGKISEQDYQELSRKYRAEAKTLLQLVDDDLGPARKRVEGLLQSRLGKIPLDFDDSDQADAELDDSSQDGEHSESAKGMAESADSGEGGNSAPTVDAAKRDASTETDEAAASDSMSEDDTCDEHQSNEAKDQKGTDRDA